MEVIEFSYKKPVPKTGFDVPYMLNWEKERDALIQAHADMRRKTVVERKKLTPEMIERLRKVRC